MILLWLIPFLSQTIFAADYYPHEVKNVMTNKRGYQEAWVTIQNPHAEKDSNEAPIELSVPFCDAKSVSHLDQTCATPDGSLMKVTEIRGKKISVEPLDLSTSQTFAAFVNQARHSSNSRMPASLAYPEVTCQASCPQLDFVNPCQATGMTKEKAYGELKKVILEKADTDCKLCNLRAVVCEGKLYQSPPSVHIYEE